MHSLLEVMNIGSNFRSNQSLSSAQRGSYFCYRTLGLLTLLVILKTLTRKRAEIGRGYENVPMILTGAPEYHPHTRLGLAGLTPPRVFNGYENHSLTHSTN